jgi:hypothetical protein
VAQPNPSVANSPAIGSLRKGVNQIVYGRIGIARRQRRKIKSEFEHRGRGESSGASLRQ